MANNPELQSKRPDKGSEQPKVRLTAGHLRFGLIGRSIFQSLPIGIVAFDPDLKIIEANPQAAKLIDLGDYLDKSLAKGTDSPGRPSLDWTQQLKSAVSTGQPRSFDEVGYTLNGKTKLLRVVCTPLRQAKRQRILGGTIIIEDITEMANIQRQLTSAEKLASLGKLTAKVAHELSNPIDGILRYVNLAMRVVEQENLDKPKEYLTHCRQGLMRMVQIVSELLEFSRSTHSPLEYVKIEQIIEDALRMMDTKAETLNIKVTRNYAPGLPQIRSGNLFQVFCNLTKNAFDAMPDGGELEISTRLETDNIIVVEFRDTGIGFPPENAQTIFEPFFTTKSKGKGTGLGLAICRDIVESYHGRITAKNAPDGGSIFTVYLPVTGNP
ncbi:MAG: ATP-binding protein [Planctomycetota bacterium]|nr:ATP-binding protein [Planctomycetota bacterium]